MLSIVLAADKYRVKHCDVEIVYNHALGGFHLRRARTPQMATASAGSKESRGTSTRRDCPRPSS